MSRKYLFSAYGNLGFPVPQPVRRINHVFTVTGQANDWWWQHEPAEEASDLKLNPNWKDLQLDPRNHEDETRLLPPAVSPHRCLSGGELGWFIPVQVRQNNSWNYPNHNRWDVLETSYLQRLFAKTGEPKNLLQLHLSWVLNINDQPLKFDQIYDFMPENFDTMNCVCIHIVLSH